MAKKAPPGLKEAMKKARLEKVAKEAKEAKAKAASKNKNKGTYDKFFPISFVYLV